MPSLSPDHGIRPTHATKKNLVARGYLLPFILITLLFFLWGFARSVLDVLNKHFQETLSISVTDSTLIQASTYLAYAVMALPAGVVITRFGYRLGVVGGLCLFSGGAFLFLPASSAASFPLFLTALFIIGCGLAVLETAANPYASELGERDTAASRLNLSQSFNGLGCILGPVTVGGFLFSGQGGGVEVPYAVMGAIVLLIAIVFAGVRLPEITPEERQDIGTLPSPGFRESCRALWASRGFRAGILALFCYEIAEIGINSLFINYATATGWLNKMTATAVLSFGALGLFMAARVGGSAVMRRIAPRRVLRVCALLTVAGSLAVVLDLGILSRAGIFCCYAFEAIMFPTIFASIIASSGRHAKIASSFLMMTPLGGAVGSFLMGHLSAASGFPVAFIVPCAAYTVVFIYSILKK